MGQSLLSLVLVLNIIYTMILNVIYSIGFMKEKVEFEKFIVKLFREIIFLFEKQQLNKKLYFFVHTIILEL